MSVERPPYQRPQYNQTEPDQQKAFEESATVLTEAFLSQIEALQHLEPDEVDPYRAQTLRPLIGLTPEMITHTLLTRDRVRKAIDCVYYQYSVEKILESQRQTKTLHGWKDKKAWNKQRNSIPKMMSLLLVKEEDREMYDPSITDREIIKNLVINPDYITPSLVRGLNLFPIDKKMDRFTWLKSVEESFPRIREIFSEATPFEFGKRGQKKIYRILALHSKKLEGKMVVFSSDYPRERGDIPTVKKVQIFSDAQTMIRSLKHTRQTYQDKGEMPGDEKGMILENRKHSLLVQRINLTLATMWLTLDQLGKETIQTELHGLGLIVQLKTNHLLLHQGEVLQIVSTLKTKDGKINPMANAAKLVTVMNRLDARQAEMIDQHKNIDLNITVSNDQTKVSEERLMQVYSDIETKFQKELTKLRVHPSQKNLNDIQGQVKDAIHLLKASHLQIQPYKEYAVLLICKLDKFGRTCPMLVNIHNKNYQPSLEVTIQSILRAHNLTPEEKSDCLKELKDQTAISSTFTITDKQRKLLHAIYFHEAKRRLVESIVTAKVFMAQKTVSEVIDFMKFQPHHFTTLGKIHTHLQRVRHLLKSTRVFPEITIDSYVTPFQQMSHAICNMIEKIENLYHKDRETRSGQQLNISPDQFYLQDIKDLDAKHQEIAEKLKAIDFMKILDTMEPA